MGNAGVLLQENPGDVRRIQASHRFLSHAVGVKAFEKQLTKFKRAKGSIQFPLDKALPLALISKRTAFRVRESLEEDAKWRTPRM